MITFLAVLYLLLIAPAPVFSWTEESACTDPCHEEFSSEAIRRAGYIKEPPALSGKDRQLYDYVQFNPSPYAPNIYMLSLLIGCRWNDLRGKSSFEIWYLLEEMSDPEDAPEHCLRSPLDNWEEGDADAVEKCRNAVRHFAIKAWSFTSEPGGFPDPDIRVDVPVFLLYTGGTDVSLSGFYYYAGRAFHTIQDSFSHTYRTEDRKQIVEVVNGVEEMVGRDFDPLRDGPGHLRVMDDCRCDRPMIDETLEAIREASAEYLQVLYGNPETRGADLEIFLNRWFTHVPGCTAANEYCSSPEPRSYSEAKCGGGCSVCAPVTDRGGLGFLLIAGMVFLVFLLRAKGSRKNHFPFTSILFVSTVVMFSFFMSKAAEAAADEKSGAAKIFMCAEMEAPEKSGPYVSFRVGGAIWRPAVAFQASGGWAWKKWQLGYVMEWNPWVALERIDFAPGAYSTGIEISYMVPVNPKLKLRFGMVQGISVLLFDPYGHHKGEIGAWSAYRIMGIDIKVSRRFTLSFDPVDMVVVIVNPVKLPLLYQQWRWSLAVRFK